MIISAKTKVVFSIAGLGAFIIGLVTLFQFFKSADVPTVQPQKNEVITSPTIQNINNYSDTQSASPEALHSSSFLQNPRDDQTVKIRDLEQEIERLKIDLNEITKENIELKNYREQLIQKNNSLSSANSKELSEELNRLKRENESYLSKIQMTGGFHAYEPTEQQKEDYRKAIERNQELIKKIYESKLKGTN